MPSVANRTMRSLPYQLDLFTLWFSARTLTEACKYTEAVSDVRWHDGELSGQVQGTSAQPYRVRIRLRRQRSGVHISGRCSCPVRVGCKHIAALLIAGVAQLAGSEA